MLLNCPKNTTPTAVVLRATIRSALYPALSCLLTCKTEVGSHVKACRHLFGS